MENDSPFAYIDAREVKPLFYFCVEKFMCSNVLTFLG